MRAHADAAIAPPALFVGVFWGLVITLIGFVTLLAAYRIAQAF